MSGQLDIQDVIERSTSQVSLDDLNRKGVKRVKVLNQASIYRLINEAVDRVMADRVDQLSKDERQRIIEQCRTKFETLSKNQLDKERSRAADLENKLMNLERRAQASVEERKAFADAAARIRELSDDRERMRAEFETLSRHVESRRERETDLQGLAEKLAVKAKELVAKEEELLVREEALRGKDEEVEAKSRELVQRTDALTSKTEELTGKVEELTSRGQEFAKREAELRRRAEELDSRQVTTESVEDLDRRRKQEIEERERELDEVRTELESVTANTEAVERLREELTERDRFLSRLEGEIAAKNDEIGRLASGNEGGDVSSIQNALEGLQKSIATTGRGGGVSAATTDVDPETMLKFTVLDDDDSMESNIDKVQVKKKKSAGVKSSLDKLKQLSKGV